jgi:hypothetical protein
LLIFILENPHESRPPNLNPAADLKSICSRLQQLHIERLLLITYGDDRSHCFRPVHDSQAHLPDDALQLFPCVFSDDFALISEGQSIPGSWVNAARLPD